jgi:hypothetical protein
VSRKGEKSRRGMYGREGKEIRENVEREDKGTKGKGSKESKKNSEGVRYERNHSLLNLNGHFPLVFLQLTQILRLIK